MKESPSQPANVRSIVQRTPVSLDPTSRRLPLFRLVILVTVAILALIGFSWDRLLNRKDATDVLAARRTRRAFERLGPTFVKLGQLISSAPGSVSAGWVDEMASCRDQVPPVPWKAVQKVIEHELGPNGTLLLDVARRPLAAGSMSQVHAARLADGTEVVVKIQRPGLERLLRQDLQLLRIAARWIVRIRPSLEAVNPAGLLEDFAQSVSQQLSFRREIANMSAMRRALRPHPVVVPKVWPDLSTDHVLVMERQFGLGVDEPDGLDASAIDRRSVLEVLVGSFLSSALNAGTFHGDLHAGNMLVRSDGRLALLDFGVVGHLNERARRIVGELLTSLVELRIDAAALAMLELVDATSADLGALAVDVQTLVGDLTTRTIRDIDMADALRQLLRMAERHNLVLPQEVVCFFKQMLFLDGICSALDPTYDLFVDGARSLECSLEAA